MTRLVLAWFVLTVAAAGLSPVVSPKAMELVCSAAGEVKLVVIDQDGQAQPVGSHTLDCSLCLAATLPSSGAAVQLAATHPLSHALRPAAQAHIAALVGAPLPARGPPLTA